jgi:hypothetical protein
MGRGDRGGHRQRTDWTVSFPRWALALWLVGVGLTAQGEEIPPSPAPAFAFQWREESPPPFAVGESINFVIKYGIIHAGVATLQVVSTATVSGRTAYKIVSEARTNKTMDVVFKVRDVNESWIDVQSLCSLQFRQDIKEGRYTRQVHTVYDHPARRFIYKKKRKGTETVHEGSIPPFVQDVLSSLYYLRTQPLEVGKNFTLDANSGATTWPLSVHVLSRETIRVPAGRYECFHIEPILAGDGIFQASGRLEIWVTQAVPHIPVLLRSKVAVGAFDAEMTEYTPGTVRPYP